MTLRVGIVGGGVSGLTVAYRLRRLLGPLAEISVIEQSDRLGGKLRTVELAGASYDIGAEAYLTRRAEVTNLVGELGMADDVVHPTRARSAVLAGGRTHPVPGRTVMGIPPRADVVRAVLTPGAVDRVAAERDLAPVRLAGADVGLGPLLRSRFGTELVDRLVDPLLGGVYASGVDCLGLRATMPSLAAALDDGASSLSEAAERVLPDPEVAGTVPVFGTLRGGLGTLVDRLATRSGARFRLGAVVRAMERTQMGWRLVLGAAAPAHAPARPMLEVDAVVLAVPAPAARRLLVTVAPAASAAFAKVELASMAVVALALPPGTELPASSGLLIGRQENRSNGRPFTAKAFTFSARKWRHLGAAREVLVRGSVGRFGEARTLRVDDAELVALVRDDLAELTGITADPVDSAVARWGGGLPQYGVGHGELVETIERSIATVAGLSVAGAALHGVGLPACVATADRAATKIAADLSRRYLPTP